MKILIKKAGEEWRLWTKDGAMESPAGWRLKKGGEFPVDRFRFSNEREAIGEASKLQAYVDGVIGANAKKGKKVSVREQRRLDAIAKIQELKATGGGGGLVAERPRYAPVLDY